MGLTITSEDLSFIQSLVDRARNSGQPASIPAKSPAESLSDLSNYVLESERARFEELIGKLSEPSQPAPLSIFGDPGSVLEEVRRILSGTPSSPDALPTFDRALGLDGLDDYQWMNLADTLEKSGLQAETVPELDQFLSGWFLWREDRLSDEMLSILGEIKLSLNDPAKKAKLPEIMAEKSRHLERVRSSLKQTLDFYMRASGNRNERRGTDYRAFIHELANSMTPLSAYLQNVKPANVEKRIPQISKTASIVESVIDIYKRQPGIKFSLVPIKKFFKYQMDNPKWEPVITDLNALEQALPGDQSFQFGTVLRELALNAIKVAEGRKIEKFELQIEQIEGGFQITDNAGGFIEKDTETLAREAVQRQEKGHGGLGSGIIRDIIAANGWELTRHSVEGGTRFVLMYTKDMKNPLPSWAAIRRFEALLQREASDQSETADTHTVEKSQNHSPTSTVKNDITSGFNALQPTSRIKGTSESHAAATRGFYQLFTHESVAHKAVVEPKQLSATRIRRKARTVSPRLRRSLRAKNSRIQARTRRAARFRGSRSLRSAFKAQRA